MERRIAYHDSLQDRIGDGVDVMRLALDRQAPQLALATAREAARAALLALGQAPLRPGKRELAVLREMATATSQHFADRLEERQALLQATLALLDRLFPRPPAAGAPAAGSFKGGD